MRQISLTNFFTKSKIFVFLLISFLVGVFFAPLVIYDQLILSVLIIVLMVFSIFFHREKPLVIFACCGICLFLGVVYCHWFSQKTIPKNLPYDQQLSLIGVIDDEPDIRTDKIKLTVKVEKVEKAIETEKVENVKKAEIKNLIGQRVLINSVRYPEYRYGNKIKVSGKLQKPETYEEFNYADYLARFKVFSIITHPASVEYIDSGRGKTIYNIMYVLKHKFKIAIEQSLPEPMSSLAEGLILGAKGNFSPELKEEMIKTGTTHIVVISGQNMEIIARAFVEITKYISPYFTFVTGTLGLALFTIMSGATPSVTRAAILASLFLFARLVGRRKQIFNPLIFTGFVMVFINPLILRFDIGFQLSFMAMLGLIFISPIFDQWLRRWPLILRKAISSTLGAQITTLPIILFNFGRISILAPVTNALILLIVPYAMLGSFLVGLLGSLWLPLGKLTSWLAYPLIKYIIAIIELFAKIPWISVNIDFHRWWWVMIYYSVLLLLLIILKNKKEAINSASS